MSSKYFELRKYLNKKAGLNSDAAEKLMKSASENCQVEINGILININGFFRAKHLLDEILEKENPSILQNMKGGFIYLFLWDNLYNCMQHDFDTKTESKIKEEGFYIEALEYWMDVVIEKINSQNSLKGGKIGE